METIILNGDAAGIKHAAALIRRGEPVAIPTETVYGLAANALDSAAVARIFAAKGRPQDNPLIVHIAEMEQLSSIAREVTPLAKKLAERFWPGPLTIILPKSENAADNVTAGLDTIAIRMPAHEIALDIIRAAEKPLAAPSANRSGRPSPTTVAHVIDDMTGYIAAIVDGGGCTVGVESTVVDVTGTVPRILRPGGITPDMIREVAGDVEIDAAVEHELDSDIPSASPGMKYKHYAPLVRVVLVKANEGQFAAWVRARVSAGENAAVMCFDDEEIEGINCVNYGRRDDYAAQARMVFDALRKVDGLGADVVYCSLAEPDGVGLAVYNRLLRAAEFEVVTI